MPNSQITATPLMELLHSIQQISHQDYAVADFDGCQRHLQPS
ncbi:MAG: hypothetical protein ACQCN4_11270 [Candidatus Bathyarchaeia archaeon]